MFKLIRQIKDKLEPLKPYNIGFSGLAEGHHRFSFEIGEAFFACFEKSEITSGEVYLSMNMEKEPSMLVFDFVLKGWIELACDRCLEGYREPVDHAYRLYVKFGDDFREESEDVIIIPREESHFDVSHYVYEFLHLGIPLRRVHPDDKDGNPVCDPDMIDRLKEHSTENHKPGLAANMNQDPREVLKALKFNKDN